MVGWWEKADEPCLCLGSRRALHHSPRETHHYRRHSPPPTLPAPPRPTPPQPTHPNRFSFYGLLPSNVTLMATSNTVYIASRVAVAVTLAGAAGAMTAAALDVVIQRRINHRPALDGAVAGLVAISAGEGGG